MDFKELYFCLFGVLSKAVEAIELGKVAEARRILIEAMQQAEEHYIEGEE